MKKSVKFGVCADVHHSLTPYVDRFLKKFLDTCLEEDVDFVIQLGDFCRPDPIDSPRTKDFSDKDQFMAMYREYPKTKHNVLGNHDIDGNTKEEILQFLGSDHGPYYSFDVNGFHFVVLDCNYAKLPDGTYLPYDGGVYYALGKGIPEEQQPFPVVPDFELQWLKEDLDKTPYPSIIFSHQRLTHQISAIRNYKEVQEVLQNAPNRVLMSINGHEHADVLEKFDGIWYYNFNSMSNVWVDDEFKLENVYQDGGKIDSVYPNIKYIVPYAKPAYGIITLDENGATVKGTKGAYVGPTPEERNVYRKGSYFEKHFNGQLSPSVEDRYIPFVK